MLSAVRFAHHWSKFRELPPIKYYGDNQSLIDCINDLLGKKHFTSGYSITSEWDFIHPITMTLKSLSSQFSVAHVKGHQDNDKPSEQLSLQAQLNVRADTLAEEYMSSTTTMMDSGILIPMSQVQLCLSEVEITHHYP